MDKRGHNFVIFSQATGQTWNHTSAYHLSTLGKLNAIENLTEQMTETMIDADKKKKDVTSWITRTRDSFTGCNEQIRAPTATLQHYLDSVEQHRRRLQENTRQEEEAELLRRLNERRREQEEYEVVYNAIVKRENVRF